MQHWPVAAAATNKPRSKAAAAVQLVCSQQEHCPLHEVHFRQQT